jgi:hypothetical protein
MHFAVESAINDFPDLSHLGLGVENMGVDTAWQQRDW